MKVVTIEIPDDSELIKTLTFPSETMACKFAECFRDLLSKTKTIIA